jgi:formylglycine-generating enzyme required for sulfatase activity
MHFSRIKGRSLGRSATGTTSKGAQLALLLCGVLGTASVLLVASGTAASPNATASNPDDRSRDQVNRKTPPAMAWIPGGPFLMGTNDKESFPNERPAHLVQVQGFWMDEHDPYSPKRVVKGGSFLCNPDYCESYRPSARRGTPPDTGSSHTGFRCVISGDNAQVTSSVGSKTSLTK